MSTGKDKLMTVPEAVSKFVRDGDMLTFSGFTIWRRPMAVVYEIVRQQKKDLHLVEVNSGTHGEVLIGAGCVKIWESSFMGHELYGKIGANLSRKVSNDEILVEDYSHVHMVYRLAAGAMGVPFLPTYCALGTDILNPEYDVLGRAGFRDGSNPRIPAQKFGYQEDKFYGGQKVLNVPAASPNVCIAHVQQVGDEGTVKVKGQRYTDSEAMKAADKLVVVAEEIVPEEVIRQEPNDNLIPHYLVDAIVEQPWGAHPTGCFGCYEVDGEFIRDFYSKTKTQEGFDAWAEEWITKVSDFNEYLNKLGFNHLDNLRVNTAMNYSLRVKRGAK
ncbi:MAG: acyl CoA--acetate/3-ketoacid CoA transferase subunit alpha [Clostridiales bacterium]|nr:acyl CoA--acetate/3-ketoacid CoA transferase subunit alpha [Clostridiales bacterium]MCF8023136.1 acyl CoA--acetate/3-ketoacid CoA transferase subunit alpha [Clostridiales bacterium]